MLRQRGNQARHLTQGRCVDFTNLNFQGVIIQRFIGANEIKLREVGELIVRVLGLIIGPFEVLGREWGAITPLHILAQLEGEGQAIFGNGITLRHIRDIFQGVLIQPQQSARVDHSLVTTRTRIGRQVGVEADGVRGRDIAILATILGARRRHLFIAGD